MTPIRIPKESERGLANIRALDEKSFQQLVSRLSEAPPTFDPAELAEKVAAHLDNVARLDVDSIVSTLCSLQTALEYFDSSIPELVGRVSRAMAQSEIQELRLTAEDMTGFQDRLAKLLGLESIGIRSRAVSLLKEEDHAYCSARVLTDIRPMFDSDLTTRPTAALIIHTMRISYHEGAELKQFYMALDSDGVTALREILARADAKAENLKSVLNAAGIPYLDVR